MSRYNRATVKKLIKNITLDCSKKRNEILSEVDSLNNRYNFCTNIRIEFINSSLREIESLLYFKVFPDRDVEAERFLYESSVLAPFNIDSNGSLMVRHGYYNEDWYSLFEEELKYFLKEKLSSFYTDNKSMDLPRNLGHVFHVYLPVNEGCCAKEVLSKVESLLGIYIGDVNLFRDDSGDWHFQLTLHRSCFSEQICDRICEKYGVSLELKENFFG